MRITVLVLGVGAALVRGQVVFDPSTGYWDCPPAGGTYCFGASLRTDTIILCPAGVGGYSSNCSDLLDGVSPVGPKGSTLCFERAGNAGNAACSYDGVAYPKNLAPFSITGLTSVEVSSTASFIVPLRPTGFGNLSTTLNPQVSTTTTTITAIQTTPTVSIVAQKNSSINAIPSSSFAPLISSISMSDSVTEIPSTSPTPLISFTPTIDSTVTIISSSSSIAVLKSTSLIPSTTSIDISIPSSLSVIVTESATVTPTPSLLISTISTDTTLTSASSSASASLGGTASSDTVASATVSVISLSVSTLLSSSGTLSVDQPASALAMSGIDANSSLISTTATIGTGITSMEIAASITQSSTPSATTSMLPSLSLSSEGITIAATRTLIPIPSSTSTTLNPPGPAPTSSSPTVPQPTTSSTTSIGYQNHPCDSAIAYNGLCHAILTSALTTHIPTPPNSTPSTTSTPSATSTSTTTTTAAIIYPAQPDYVSIILPRPIANPPYPIPHTLKPQGANPIPVPTHGTLSKVAGPIATFAGGVAGLGDGLNAGGLLVVVAVGVVGVGLM